MYEKIFHATHPDMMTQVSNEQLRERYLISNLFVSDRIKLNYCHQERFVDAQRSEAILARIPAGRWGKPDDLAGAAVFLSGRASDYVHGITLPVDGGWLAR